MYYFVFFLSAMKIDLSELFEKWQLLSLMYFCEFSQACGGFVSPQERDAGVINQTDERPVLGG